jgi:hypothetical protein
MESGKESAMRKLTLLAATLLVGLGCLGSGPAAAAEFEIIGEFYIRGLSDDGTAASGSTTDGYFSPVRWTAQDGVVPLGQSPGEVLGRLGGLIGISADGQRIACSIASLDSSVVTQGRWTKGYGWEETMPPLAADGQEVDGALGSGYSISGDGQTVVGFYWATGARAHASAWTSSGGIVNLHQGSADRNGRADCVNFDGSVIGGWFSGETGARNPAVWEDGVMTALHEDPAGNGVTAVNSEGTVLAGATHDVATSKNPLTIWSKNGGAWQQSVVGVLPGTFAGGRAVPWDMTDDGSMVVGKNMMSPSGFNAVKGFVWTIEQGLMEAENWIESQGVVVPSDLTVQSLTSITPDGRVVGGYGILGDPYGDGVIVSFLLTRGSSTPAPVARTSRIRLEQANPNPFNPSTSLPLFLDQSESIQLKIYDIAGRHVRTLHDGILPAGRTRLVWDGRDDAGRVAPSGVYFARAAGRWGMSESRRMTLIK